MPASYSLGPHFEDLIRRQVRSGRFASASEVVREGLRLIEERDAEREARLEALRSEIAQGRESGPSVPADEAFARVRAGIDEARLRPNEPHLDRNRIIERLRAHEAELKALGIEHLSLFGSVARGEAGSGSDVDLAVRLDHARGIDLLDFAEINLRLGDLLGAKVDLVSEPARKPDFQAEIDRDRVHAF